MSGRFSPLPPALMEKSTLADTRGSALWAVRQFATASKVFQDVYEELKRSQRVGERYHKGGPLHNRGVSLIYAGEPSDAVLPIILAYIEDCLSEGARNPTVDTLPAAETLRNYFRLPAEPFERIKQTVELMDASGVTIQDPELVYTEFLRQSGKSEEEMEEVKTRLRKKRNYRSFDRDWNRRVFVGAAYRDPSRLESIRAIVTAEAYEAIIASDFETPQDEVRHHALMLLHSCRLAIFDMAIEAGQLIEVDRCLDYQVRPLIIYPAWDPDEEARISAMIRSLPFEKRPYSGVSHFL